MATECGGGCGWVLLGVIRMRCRARAEAFHVAAPTAEFPGPWQVLGSCTHRRGSKDGAGVGAHRERVLFRSQKCLEGERWVMADFGQTDFGQFKCFSVLAQFSEPKKPKLQRPKDLHSDLNPTPQTPQTQTLNPGRGGPTIWGPPFAPPSLRGHTYSGFGLHPPCLAVLVLLWLWLLWLLWLLVWTLLDHPAPDPSSPPPDRPKFRAFLPSPATIFALFVSLWVSSR